MKIDYTKLPIGTNVRDKYGRKWTLASIDTGVHQPVRMRKHGGQRQRRYNIDGQYAPGTTSDHDLDPATIQLKTHRVRYDAFPVGTKFKDGYGSWRELTKLENGKAYFDNTKYGYDANYLESASRCPRYMPDPRAFELPGMVVTTTAPAVDEPMTKTTKPVENPLAALLRIQQDEYL